MTRSIGDLELKPFGVTAVPDVRKLKVDWESECFRNLIIQRNYALVIRDI